jgi:putative pyrroloquinoline-quinone binding quinoprotein/PQQ enzyme-like repeat protein
MQQLYVCRLRRGAAVPAFMLIISLTAGSAWAADWPQLQGNAARTGRTTDSVAPPYRMKWAWLGPGNTQTTLPIAGGSSVTIAGRAQPVIAAGRVFIGTMEGTAHAINATTGQTIWSAPIPGGTLSSAAVAGGIAVFVTVKGFVIGLNASTGAEVWRYDSGYAITGAPCAEGTRVYVANHRGDVIALDPASGTLLWKQRVLAPVEGDIAADANAVYVPAEDLNVYSLSASSGTINAQHRVLGQSFQNTNPMVFNGKLWVTSVMGPAKGSEYIFDAMLDSAGTFDQEEALTDRWLDGDTNGGAWPDASRDWRHRFALDLPALTEPFKILCGPTEGVGNPPESMMVDNQGRILFWWKTRYPTLTKIGAFGTRYSLDIAAVNQTTGRRIRIDNGRFSNMWPGPETDNLYQLSVGGDYVWLRQRFRGTEQIQLSTSQYRLVQAAVGIRDGGDFTFADVVYVPTGSPPPSPSPDTEGHAAVAISGTQVYISEPFGIVVLEHRP